MELDWPKKAGFCQLISGGACLISTMERSRFPRNVRFWGCPDRACIIGPVQGDNGQGSGLKPQSLLWLLQTGVVFIRLSGTRPGTSITPVLVPDPILLSLKVYFSTLEKDHFSSGQRRPPQGFIAKKEKADQEDHLRCPLTIMLNAK